MLSFFPNPHHAPASRAGAFHYTTMRFKETIRLHGVAVDVCGTWEPAEPPTYDHPGSGAEISVTRYEIGGVDVGDLIDAADWYEEIDILILAAVGEPVEA